MNNSEKKSKDKYLYKCDSYVDVDEYLKMSEYFPISLYMPFVIRGLFFNYFLTLIVLIITKSWYITIIFFIIIQVIIALYCKKSQKKLLKKAYINSREEKSIYSRFFYENYLLSKKDNEVLEFKYDEVEEIVETDNNIYLSFTKLNKIVVIQKDKCSTKLIEFLKDKFKGLDKSKSQRSLFTELFLYSLLMITLIAVPMSMQTYDLVYNISYIHDNPFWVILLFLIIPICSIAVGMYYKNKEINSKTVTATIIIGFIVFIILLFFALTNI